MSSLWLLVVGLGSPALGMLVGRRLTAEDVGRSIREHHQALATLAEVTRSTAQRR